MFAVPAGANSQADNSSQASYKSSHAYNSLWAIRADAWSSLEESTAQLSLAAGQQRPVDELIETLAGSLEFLGSIERFWGDSRHAGLPEGPAAVRDR